MWMFRVMLSCWSGDGGDVLDRPLFAPPHDLHLLQPKVRSSSSRPRRVRSLHSKYDLAVPDVGPSSLGAVCPLGILVLHLLSSSLLIRVHLRSLINVHLSPSCFFLSLPHSHPHPNTYLSEAGTATLSPQQTRSLALSSSNFPPSPRSSQPSTSPLPPSLSMATPARTVHDALLFECAWEVANKGQFNALPHSGMGGEEAEGEEGGMGGSSSRLES